MNAPVFIRKDNYLTVYAHGCGYLDSATVGDDRMAVTLGREAGVYHVKGRECNGARSEWESFDPGERDAAVSAFRRMMRERGATRNTNYMLRGGR